MILANFNFFKNATNFVIDPVELHLQSASVMEQPTEQKKSGRLRTLHCSSASQETHIQETPITEGLLAVTTNRFHTGESFVRIF